MVGLWHYSFPGFFILAQFGLGVLVALVNLVNNSVFLYISDEASNASNVEPTPKGEQMLIDREVYKMEKMVFRINPTCPIQGVKEQSPSSTRFKLGSFRALFIKLELGSGLDRLLFINQFIYVFRYFYIYFSYNDYILHNICYLVFFIIRIIVS